MQKKGEKRGLYLVILLLGILMISVASAGWVDWVKKITGRATSGSFEMNITIGVPQIVEVWNDTDYVASPTEDGGVGDTFDDVVINFSVYSPSGAGNLNDTSATANLTLTDDSTVRENTSCVRTDVSGDYANYSCNISVSWYDAAGNWNISVYIEDNETNGAQNITVWVVRGQTTGTNISLLSGSPGNLTFPAIAPGAENKTATNDAIRLNNTGNDPIADTAITVNATHLRGEDTPTEALWAGNFSVDWRTGGSCSGASCVECAGTGMVNFTQTGISGANLSIGNFTANNDGALAQEDIYVCMRYAGTELSTQSYSTGNETEGLWTVEKVFGL